VGSSNADLPDEHAGALLSLSLSLSSRSLLSTHTFVACTVNRSCLQNHTKGMLVVWWNMSILPCFGVAWSSCTDGFTGFATAQTFLRPIGQQDCCVDLPKVSFLCYFFFFPSSFPSFLLPPSSPSSFFPPFFPPFFLLILLLRQRTREVDLPMQVTSTLSFFLSRLSRSLLSRSLLSPLFRVRLSFFF